MFETSYNLPASGTLLKSVIAIGPKGGKIIGYDVHHKPIYEGSDTHKKLQAVPKPEQKKDDSTNLKSILDWLSHIGVDAKADPQSAMLVVGPNNAKKLASAFGVALGATTPQGVKVWWPALIPHVGKPLLPSKEQQVGVVAALAAGTFGSEAPFPEELVSSLKVAGALGGSHGGKILKAPDGTQFAWKANSGQEWVCRAEEAFLRVGALVMPESFPKGEVVTNNGEVGVLTSWVKGEPLGSESSGHSVADAAMKKHAAALMRHHILDWLMGNHDAHGANFLVTSSGKVACVGIDKGQAFKFITDKGVTPLSQGPGNGSSPVYQQLWQMFKDGKLPGVDPVAEAQKVFAELAKISPEQYAQIVEPYFSALAKHKSPTNVIKARNAALERFNTLKGQWEKFLTEQTGKPVTLGSTEVPATTLPASSPALAPEKPLPQVEAPPSPPVVVQKPGWPMTKGNVTVHNPGGPVPAGVKWKEKYPGPGFHADIVYKGKKYTLKWDAVDGKFLADVTFPDGKALLAHSPQEAADLMVLFNAGKPLTATSTQLKEWKLGYSISKLLKLDEFAADFKAAASIPEKTDEALAPLPHPSPVAPVEAPPPAPIPEPPPPAPPVNADVLMAVPVQVADTEVTQFTESKAGEPPVGAGTTVVKTFKKAPLSKLGTVTLTVLPNGKFLLSGGTGGMFNGGPEFKSLSAACDHVWLVANGYSGMDDYKIQTGKKTVPSGGGWKFWGLAAAPAPDAPAVPVAPAPEPVPPAPKPDPVQKFIPTTGKKVWEGELVVTPSSPHPPCPPGTVLLHKETNAIYHIGEDGQAGLSYATLKILYQPGVPGWDGMYTHTPTPADLAALPEGTKVIQNAVVFTKHVTHYGGSTVTEWAPEVGSNATLFPYNPTIIWGKLPAVDVKESAKQVESVVHPPKPELPPAQPSLNVPFPSAQSFTVDQLPNAVKALVNEKLNHAAALDPDSLAKSSKLPAWVPPPLLFLKGSIPQKSGPPQVFYITQCLGSKNSDGTPGDMTKFMVVSEDGKDVNWGSANLDAKYALLDAIPYLWMKNGSISAPPYEAVEQYIPGVFQGLWPAQSTHKDAVLPPVGDVVVPGKEIPESEKGKYANVQVSVGEYINSLIAATGNGITGDVPGTDIMVAKDKKTGGYKVVGSDQYIKEFQAKFGGSYENKLGYSVLNIAGDKDVVIPMKVEEAATLPPPAETPSSEWTPALQDAFKGWNNVKIQQALESVGTGAMLQVTPALGKPYLFVKLPSGNWVTKNAFEAGHWNSSQEWTSEDLSDEAAGSKNILPALTPSAAFKGNPFADGKIPDFPSGTKLYVPAIGEITLQSDAETWKDSKGNEYPMWDVASMDGVTTEKISGPSAAAASTAPKKSVSELQDALDMAKHSQPLNAADEYTLGKFPGTWLQSVLNLDVKLKVLVDGVAYEAVSSGSWQLKNKDGDVLGKLGKVNTATFAEFLLEHKDNVLVESTDAAKWIPPPKGKFFKKSVTSSALKAAPIGTVIIGKTGKMAVKLSHDAWTLGGKHPSGTPIVTFSGNVYNYIVGSTLGQSVVYPPKVTGFFSPKLSANKMVKVGETPVASVAAYVEEFYKGYEPDKPGANPYGDKKEKAAPAPEPSVPELTPEQKAAAAEKLAKLKEEQAKKMEKYNQFKEWAKVNPKVTDPQTLKALAWLKTNVDVAFYAHTNGQYTLLGPETESALKKLKLSPEVVATPMGDLLRVPTVSLVAAFPQATLVKGEDGKDYPHGTEFQWVDKPTKTKKQVLAEAGVTIEPMVTPASPDDFAAKLSGTTPAQLEKLKEVLASAGLKPFKAFTGGYKSIAFVKNKSVLDEPVAVTKELVATIPPQPAEFIPKGVPFSSGPQSQGSAAIPNSADLDSMEAIKPTEWGHAVMMGQGKTLWKPYVIVKKVIVDGVTYNEVHGELTSFDNDKAKLKAGKYRLLTTDKKNQFKDETGVHDTTTSVEKSYPGYEYNKDGMYLGIANDSAGYALKNQFVLRVPATDDLRARLKEAFTVMGKDAEEATAPYDETTQERWIQAEIIRQKMGAKAFHGDVRAAFADPTWLKEKSKTYSEHVKAAQVVVGGGNIPRVISNVVPNVQKAHYLYTGTCSEVAIHHLVKGQGIPARSQAYRNGSDSQDGASPSADMNTGGAYGLFTRLVGEDVSGTSGCGSHSAVKIIYHPRALLRTDVCYYKGDSYGTLSPGATSTLPGSLHSVSSSNEVLFHGGMDMKDIAGVACTSSQERNTVIKALKAAGKTEVNGIPLDQFVFVESLHSKIKEACNGLKDGVLP